MGGHGLADVEVDDAGLDNGQAVLDVHLQDATHAGHGDGDAALGRDGAAAEAGAGATGHYRQVEAADYLHHLRHLLGGGRQDYGLGEAALDGGVVLVDQEVFGRVQDVLLPDDGLELADQLAVGHGGISLTNLTRMGNG